MNRRQFIKFTAALAAASAGSLMPSSPPEAALPVPVPPPVQWIPTQAEVDWWLEYYKLCVTAQAQTLTQALANSFTVTDIDAIVSAEDVKALAAAEKAWGALEAQRQRVGWVQGQGYAAGRYGAERFNPLYKGPSHPAFAWYNSWAVGNFDLRWTRGEVSLPRSPGVTFPTKALKAPT